MLSLSFLCMPRCKGMVHELKLKNWYVLEQTACTCTCTKYNTHSNRTLACMRVLHGSFNCKMSSTLRVHTCMYVN